MTAIAALIQDGKVWMGGDSAGVAGWYSLAVRRDPKVFKLGEWLIGFTSSFRMGQIIRHYLSFEAPKEKEDLYEYMVTTFVYRVRKLLKDYGYMEVHDNREHGGEFIVGWRQRLFLIASDMQVAELSDPFAATGCGRDLIYGSLHTTEQFELKPKVRIELALNAAERFSAGVRRPFVVLSV